MPWACREAGQPAEALPAPFQTSRSSCGCCSCTTRTFRSGRTAAGHAAAAQPAGGGGVEALCCRAAQTSHATHGSSQLRQADELARPRRRRAGAGRRLPAITRRRRRSADAPRRRGGRLARRRQQHASARLMPRAALGAPSLFWQRPRVPEDTIVQERPTECPIPCLQILPRNDLFPLSAVSSTLSVLPSVERTLSLVGADEAAGT